MQIKQDHLSNVQGAGSFVVSSLMAEGTEIRSLLFFNLSSDSSNPRSSPLALDSWWVEVFRLDRVDVNRYNAIRIDHPESSDSSLVNTQRLNVDSGCESGFTSMHTWVSQVLEHHTGAGLLVEVDDS